MRTRDETAKRMRDYRRLHNIPYQKMARALYIPGLLLDQIENGDWITHPRIAARICAAYKLDVDDYNNMVARHNRTDKLPKASPPPGFRWRAWESLNRGEL